VATPRALSHARSVAGSASADTSAFFKLATSAASSSPFSRMMRRNDGVPM
jgi:hypothetical protein